MAATWAAYMKAFAETWTNDTLVSQLYEGNALLDKVERTSEYTVGLQASVPIETYRTGGITITDTSGSSALNPAGNVGIDKATYGLSFDYNQIKIEHSAIVSSGNSTVAKAKALDSEVSSAVAETRKQINRQLFGDQSGLITNCGTTTASTTVVLNVSRGYAALVRDQLHQTLTVDIGSTSNPTSVAAGRQIIAVSESSTAPTITISGAAVTTAATDYISLSGSRSGSTSKEMNGLQNIISDTAALGGISAGGKWIGNVDTTTTTLTLNSLMSLNRKVAMHAGNKTQFQVFMSFAQMQNFYAELQNQVRFDADKVSGGDMWSAKYLNMEIWGEPDVPDGCVFFFDPRDLILVTGASSDGGTAGWMSGLQSGSNKPGLTWSQGTTAFSDAYYYVAQLGARRRNRLAAMTNLSSPA